MLVEAAVKKNPEKIYVRHIIRKLRIILTGQAYGIQIIEIIFMLCFFFRISKAVVTQENDDGRRRGSGKQVIYQL